MAQALRHMPYVPIHAPLQAFKIRSSRDSPVGPHCCEGSCMAGYALRYAPGFQNESGSIWTHLSELPSSGRLGGSSQANSCRSLTLHSPGCICMRRYLWHRLPLGAPHTWRASPLGLGRAPWAPGSLVGSLRPIQSSCLVSTMARIITACDRCTSHHGNRCTSLCLYGAMQASRRWAH